MAGSMSMVPLGIVTVVSTTLAAAAYVWLVRRRTKASHAVGQTTSSCLSR
jgi:hypothetical protein